MVHIRKIKTLYGLKYAVVDKFTHFEPKLDKKGNLPANSKVDYEKKEKYYAVEYGRGIDTKIAIFPLTEEGLQQAKEVQKLFKKAGNK